MSKADSPLWQRNAVIGAFAVALMAFALHTRMAWLYFRPAPSMLSDMLPWPGPLWLTAWAAHGARLLAALLFFFSLPGLGRLCLPRRWQAPPFAAAGVGLLVWGLLGFLAAAAGVSTPGVLKAASLVLAAAGIAAGGRPTLSIPFDVRPLLPFAAFYGLTTLVPEVFYDALVYHLAAPHAWLQAGRMTDMPDVHLWRLPGLMQPLYLWGLAWSDDRLCKLMNVGIGLLAAGHLGRWAGDRWGRAAGTWAAVLFLSAPMVGVNLWACANDIPAGLFAFLALTTWLKGWEKPVGDKPLLFLAGLFLGAGASIKTTALFAGPYFLFDALARGRRRRPEAPYAGSPRASLEALIAFGAGFLIPLLPWWIRTGLWTGNPVFPQAARLLGGDTPQNVALLQGWHAEAGGPEGLFVRALSLVRESLRGVEEGRFGFVGPALLMLLPLFFFLRPDPAHGALAGYALAAYVVFIAATGRLRYFLPHLPPLFALAAAGLADYAAATAASREKLFRGLGRALPGLAAAAVALNLAWMAMVFQRFNQGWPVIWGRQSADEYLRQEHVGVYGHPSQGALDWLRENGARGRLFLIGEARTHRSPLPARAAASFNVPPYAGWAGDPPSTESLLAGLKAEGFTYLLINVEEMKRITPDAYKTPSYLQALGALFDRAAPPLYRDRWCILFKLP